MRQSMAGMLFLVAALTLIGGSSAWAADDSSSHEEPFRYDPASRRDPFVPLVREGKFVPTTPGQTVATAQPTLFGILWDPGGSSIALINDGEYKVGDSVEGYRVKEIRQDAVVLTNGGEPVVLKLAFETPPAKLSPGTTTGGKKR